jgi:MGT family glycosyltransferase
VPHKEKARPLVYISMGTVINDRPDFYAKCIEALKNENADVIISCGNALDISVLGELPENIKVYPYVDQLDVLSKADAFITHCGMNSVSESLYMATPMILYPQTGEQQAVARRAKEIGAGVMLTNDSVQGIRSAVLEILNNNSYAASAKECSDDFRSCPGTVGAAEFIENAPHASDGIDILDELNKSNGKIQIAYWTVVAFLIVLFGLLISWKYVWIVGVFAGILSTPVTKAIQKKKYNSLIKNLK